MKVTLGIIFAYGIGLEVLGFVYHAWELFFSGIFIIVIALVLAAVKAKKSDPPQAD